MLPKSTLSDPLCDCPGCESVGTSDAVSGQMRALTFGGRFVGSLSASGF